MTTFIDDTLRQYLFVLITNAKLLNCFRFASRRGHLGLADFQKKEVCLGSGRKGVAKFGSRTQKAAEWYPRISDDIFLMTFVGPKYQQYYKVSWLAG